MKNNRMVAFESILERDFFIILEFEQDVLQYHEQPFTIQYKLNNLQTRYTPDALVTYKNNVQKVYEVKYQNEIDLNKDLQYKLSTVSYEISKQKSLNFDIFTDKSFKDIYLKNCIFLYHYAFLIPNKDLISRIKFAISSLNSPISIQSLLEHLTSVPIQQQKILPHIWLIVFQNNNIIEMQQKITMSTNIKGKI